MAMGNFERFTRALRPSWLKGPKGKAIMGSFARVLGDLSVAWADFAQQQHHPQLALSEALPLIGSERLLPQGPHETDASYAIRLTGAVQAWQRAGTPLGLLSALHWGGFPNAVIVQQNGLGFSFSSPPPAGVDPLSLFVVTPLSTLIAPLHSDKNLARSIPAGNSWWTFDSNTDLCSRFWILFPTVADAFVTWGTATFTGVEDGINVPWPTATWNNPFSDTTYSISPGCPEIDSNGIVAVNADASTKTKTGVQIVSSAPFVGTVRVLAYAAGTNPFCSPSSAALTRLRNIVKLWRPAKATCVGAYVLVRGSFMGWPVRLASAAPPSNSQVVAFTGGF